MSGYTFRGSDALIFISANFLMALSKRKEFAPRREILSFWICISFGRNLLSNEEITNPAKLFPFVKMEVSAVKQLWHLYALTDWNIQLIGEIKFRLQKYGE